jgi:signal transduction histidine kinase
MNRRTYQQRIFIYFFAAFTLFAISVLVFQYNREKSFKTQQLEARLGIISEVVNAYIKNYGISEADSSLNEIVGAIIPQDVRITLIDQEGLVMYDSFVEAYPEMENHLKRPEIQKAFYSGDGSNIRHSETTGQDFYYYARFFDGFFVRCAVVYDIEVKDFLKTERLFIFFMIAQFIIFGILLYIVTNRLGIIINRLRAFTMKAGKNEDIDQLEEFSDTEFGEIQNQVIQIYSNLKRTRDELTVEKDRLSKHLLALNEGVAFFSSKKKKLLANSNFIQYINMISDESSISAEHFFEIQEMEDIINDVEDILSSDVPIQSRNLPQFQYTLFKNEKYFSVQAIVFADRSFEIIIRDITKPEKRRLLKQQLTSNIAHELKTPLSSIHGYLETLMNSKDLDPEKISHFLERAFSQSERLNNLLNDVSVLNNIEDAGDLFEFKDIILKHVVDDVIENLEARLSKNNIQVNNSIGPGVMVKGNDSLISSIFQNLIENSINYGGEGIEIKISQSLEDENFYYFTYSDTGVGIPEEHISRIFERFYRVDEGRTREAGGTGLGLSIVKNAVQLHKGKVSVKNVVEGGLEFFFSLAKNA